MIPRYFALDVAALALFAAIVLILLALIGYLRAEPALPYPKGREQCSSGYVQSGSFCVPKSGGTVRPAVPRPPGASCPSGWVASGGACERAR